MSGGDNRHVCPARHQVIHSLRMTRHCPLLPELTSVMPMAFLSAIVDPAGSCGAFDAPRQFARKYKQAQTSTNKRK
jgi:hypothetical protein